MAEEVAHTHYVARVIIERVNHMQEAAKTHVHNSEPTPTGRKVTELADIKLKANDIDVLKGKLERHIDLVDDIEVIDDRPKGNVRPTVNDRVR